MPEFMDVHRGMVGITADGLLEAHNADLAIQDEEGIDFKQPWADPESASIACPRPPRKRPFIEFTLRPATRTTRSTLCP